jgi:hypothetical protein
MKRTANQSPTTAEAHLSSIPFNVLGYQEEGEWVALALEMDLRGYGQTFEQALAELADLMAMQIGFAQFKGQPELVWKPAEPVWFQLFADTRRQHLEALLRERKLTSSEYQVAALQIPPAALLASIKSGFSQSKA